MGPAKSITMESALEQDEAQASQWSASGSLVDTYHMKRPLAVPPMH